MYKITTTEEIVYALLGMYSSNPSLHCVNSTCTVRYPLQLYYTLLLSIITSIMDIQYTTYSAYQNVLPQASQINGRKSIVIINTHNINKLLLYILLLPLTTNLTVNTSSQRNDHLTRGIPFYLFQLKISVYHVIPGCGILIVDLGGAALSIFTVVITKYVKSDGVIV